jgi:DNA-binding NarL/FixJ family response regulator
LTIRSVLLQTGLNLNKINIAILEDSVEISERLRHIINSSDIAESVETYFTNKDLQNNADISKIDLCLVDIKLPDGLGFSSIVHILNINPECLIIIISSLSDPTTIMKAISLGAIGYLHKDDPSLGIIQSIKEAVLGGSPITPSIAKKIVISMHEKNNKALPTIKLTQREIEVLTILSKGYSYVEAADIMGISINTLPVHVRHIYKKMGISNRTEMLIEARERGIIQ